MSVVVVMLVRWVDADSVDVLMVELQDEFITMTFGTVEEFLALCALLLILLVLAVLKYSRRSAVPVGAFTIIESVSELLEV